MTRPALPRGVYAVTDSTLTPDEQLPLAVAAAVRGGAGIVQYRNKDHDAAMRLREAAMLRSVCTQAGALFIVNDDVALAEAVGADGVHLGKDDAGPRDVRARTGGSLIIGVSCYADPAAAREAVAAGADYVAFGSVFASPIKPAAVRAPLELLGLGPELGVPVVAIGGIDADNIAAVASAGAHAAAVISGLFARPDPEAAARALSAAFAECALEGHPAADHDPPAGTRPGRS